MKSLILKFAVILSLPLISSAILIIHSLTLSPLAIFPNEKFRHATFSDHAEGGKSTIDAFSSAGSSINMKYTLREGYRIPYAGLLITSGKFIDLKDYDSVKITVNSAKSEKLRFMLISFIKNFSKSTKPLSNMYLIKELPVTKEIKTFDISLSEFRVEKWWYEVNELDPFDKSIKPDLSSISAVNIENAECFGVNNQDEIIINEITFHKSGKHKWFIFAALTILYLILAYVFRKNIFSPKQKSLFSDYKKIEFKKNISNNHEIILRIISDNYTDPELSVEKAAELSCIEAFKISKIIKKSTGLSFPQYLNAVRITEAKRLLIETGVKIIEISFAVGFGNLSHFNRCFKTSEKMSPKEYRKEYRKTKTHRSY